MNGFMTLEVRFNNLSQNILTDRGVGMTKPHPDDAATTGGGSTVSPL